MLSWRMHQNDQLFSKDIPIPYNTNVDGRKLYGRKLWEGSTADTPRQKNQYTIMLSAKSPISSELPKISLPKSHIIWYFAYILLIIDFSISKGF